jgi:hypothetical protein
MPGEQIDVILAELAQCDLTIQALRQPCPWCGDVHKRNLIEAAGLEEERNEFEVALLRAWWGRS